MNSVYVIVKTKPIICQVFYGFAVHQSLVMRKKERLIFSLIYFADLNLEHLQLLLFVFHNFSSTRREALLLRCARAIIQVTRAPVLTKSTPVALARLLLLLDYFVHHFSAPPEGLFKQVQCRICFFLVSHETLTFFWITIMAIDCVIPQSVHEDR